MFKYFISKSAVNIGYLQDNTNLSFLSKALEFMDMYAFKNNGICFTSESCFNLTIKQ